MLEISFGFDRELLRHPAYEQTFQSLVKRAGTAYAVDRRHSVGRDSRTARITTTRLCSCSHAQSQCVCPECCHIHEINLKQDGRRSLDSALSEDREPAKQLLMHGSEPLPPEPLNITNGPSTSSDWELLPSPKSDLSTNVAYTLHDGMREGKTLKVIDASLADDTPSFHRLHSTLLRKKALNDALTGLERESTLIRCLNLETFPSAEDAAPFWVQLVTPRAEIFCFNSLTDICTPKVALYRGPYVKALTYHLPLRQPDGRLYYFDMRTRRNITHISVNSNEDHSGGSATDEWIPMQTKERGIFYYNVRTGIKQDAIVDATSRWL